jgi:asparaginyl-tRNA synthetase
VRADARAPGGFELSTEQLTLIGASEEYPIQPKEHGVDFLLDNRHLWLRSSQQRAIMRVRSEVEQAIHDFYYERGFLRVDTPILTGAIGEGGAGLFEVDYFEEQAYLAQTGQLYAEAAAAAFGRKVYCFGPTFRAEKSKTRRHLTEFWMCEPEMAWADADANMKLQEEFVAYLVQRALERCGEELEGAGARHRTAGARAAAVPARRYTEAVRLLQEKGHEIQWGDDLGAPDETVLGDMHDRPVFIMNYPKVAKAFYMKENPADPRTVLCATSSRPRATARSSAAASARTTTTSCSSASARRACPRSPTAGSSSCGSTARSPTPASAWASSAPSPGSRAARTSAR